MYRYEVANPGFGVMPNRYGRKIIGFAVKVGRWAYCVKWRNA